MKLIDLVSEKIANKLVGKYPSEMPSYVRTKYSIKFLVTNILPLLILFLIAIIDGNYTDYVKAIVPFALLRQVSGGYHIKNADICVIVSILLIAIISNYSYLMYNHQTLMITMSMVLCLIYAPSKIEGKTIVKKNKQFIFKIISIVVVILSILINDIIMTAAVFVQSLLLIRVIPLREVKRNEN